MSVTPEGDVADWRLDVLCGRLVLGHPRCTGVLGWIEPTWERDDVAIKTGPPRYVLGTGWIRDADGSYRMAKRARERAAAGRRPRLRRGTARIHPELLAKLPADLRDAGSRRTEENLSPALPAVVRCPACMTLNRLEG